MSMKLENSFGERYQHRLTKLELQGKNKLQKKYSQIDKKFNKGIIVP